MENCEVVDIDKDAQDFRVAAKDGTTVTAPVALVCAGAWAGKLSAAFGEPVPMEPHGPSHGRDRAGALWHRAGGRRHDPDPARDHVLPPGQARQHRVRRRPARHRRTWTKRRAQPGRTPRCSSCASCGAWRRRCRKLHVLRTWSGIEGYMRRRPAGHGPQPAGERSLLRLRLLRPRLPDWAPASAT